MADQPTAALLALARDIWASQAPTVVGVIPPVLGVIAGDISRIVRTYGETAHLDEDGLARELGNLILSAVRWAADLGLDPDQCVAVAAVAQRAYVAGLEARRLAAAKHEVAP